MNSLNDAINTLLHWAIPMEPESYHNPKIVKNENVLAWIGPRDRICYVTREWMVDFDVQTSEFKKYGMTIIYHSWGYDRWAVIKAVGWRAFLKKLLFRLHCTIRILRRLTNVWLKRVPEL